MNSQFFNKRMMRGLAMVFLIVLSFGSDLLAQTPIPLGPQIAFYNDTRVRGYHFTATSNWGLCGLYIPTDQSTGPMNVEFVRFTQGPPPAFAGTTNNFISLFYAAGVPGTNMIPVPTITVTSGNIYGTYGARSNPLNLTQMMNSYGATNTVTSVNGTNMTLQRSGMQFPLNNQQMHDIWSEVNFNIGRVIMYYDCCPSPPAPVFDQAPQQICANDTFTYSIDTTLWSPWQIQSVSWSLGPGATIISANNDSSIVQIIFASGAFQDTVCAALTDTCRTGPETCVPVIVNPLFADAGNDTSVCTTTIQLNGNAGLGTWSVVQGSGTFSNQNDPNAIVSGMTPGAVNSFQWQLSNQNCPTVSDDVNITVNPVPVNQFTAADGCQGAPIYFESQSYALGGNIIDWDWDVDGDGIVDYTLPSFNHAYSSVGIVQCTLIVTANLGCKDTLIQPIEVFPNPNTDFAYTPDCEGSPMSFTDISSISSGAITSWYWDFGDGTSATAEDPAHIYAEDSIYIVSLTAYSDKGCSATKTDSVEVYTIPTVDFTAPPKCWNQPVQFTDMSTSQQGTIIFWEWDFGDGSTNALTQDTAYQYGAAAGVYNVRLTVATDRGCTNSVIKPLNIYPVPIPAFTTSGVCQDARIEFKDASILDTVFGSELTAWNYDFADGKFENAESPGHFFEEPGIYWVKYSPETNYGCTQTDSQEVMIRPAPQANMVILDDKVCAKNKINFKDESYFDYTYDPTGIVKWLWEFGDGFSSAKQDPGHTYQEGGNYKVLMAVETSFGCTDSVVRKAVVFHNPVAEFSVDSNEGCSPYCVVFRDESRVKTAEDLIYSWRFGDGRSSTNVNPTYCFTVEDGMESETYNTRLFVTTQDGCTDSTLVAQPVTVHSNPIADFNVHDQSLDFLDPKVFIENTSIGGQFWDWDFGDGNTSVVMDPIEHEYIEPGTFNISLRAESRYGCVDVTTQKLFIERHQTFYIPKSFSPNGDGLNDFFFLEGEDLEEVKLWVYDRWGNLLFYGEDENARWDGRVDNTMSPIGAYGYVVSYRHTGTFRRTEHGTFFISKTNSKRQ